MLLGMGAAEIVIGLPVLIAAVMANCTGTTIAMAAWVTFHGLVGLLEGLTFYFLYGPTAGTKRVTRYIFYATIVIGIGLGLAAAIQGGVGNLIGWYRTEGFVAPGYYTGRQPVQGIPYGTVNQVNATGNGTNVTNGSNGYTKHWYHPYDYDLFFGVFVGVFECCLLAWGIWSIFADKRKVEEMKSLANSRNASFASLALYRQNLEQEQMKHSHSGFFNKKKESKVDLTVLPEDTENADVPTVVSTANVVNSNGATVAKTATTTKTAKVAANTLQEPVVPPLQTKPTKTLL